MKGQAFRLLVISVTAGVIYGVAYAASIVFPQVFNFESAFKLCVATAIGVLLVNIAENAARLDKE